MMGVARTAKMTMAMRAARGPLRRHVHERASAVRFQAMPGFFHAPRRSAGAGASGVVSTASSTPMKVMALKRRSAETPRLMDAALSVVGAAAGPRASAATMAVPATATGAAPWKAFMMSPPVAGPMTRAALKEIPLRVMAFERSSRGTRRGVSTCHAGMLKATAMPCASIRTSSTRGVAKPKYAAAAIASAMSIMQTCVSTIRVLRLTLSATRPPNMPRMSVGPSWAAARYPIHASDLVCCETIQRMATNSNQLPR